MLRKTSDGTSPKARPAIVENLDCDNRSGWARRCASQKCVSSAVSIPPPSVGATPSVSSGARSEPSSA